MANPHQPQHPQQSPDGAYDPAGSTQMFRAFVDEGAPAGRGAAAAPASHARAAGSGSGRRVGVLLAVIVGIAVVAAAAWLALS